MGGDASSARNHGGEVEAAMVHEDGSRGKPFVFYVEDGDGALQFGVDESRDVCQETSQSAMPSSLE